MFHACARYFLDVARSNRGRVGRIIRCAESRVEIRLPHDLQLISALITPTRQRHRQHDSVMISR
jgi:hypothetical protein